MTRAIFPGSFDPFTIGHYSIVNRALAFVDEVVVAIGVNDAKRTTFSLETRIDIIKKAFDKNPRVNVMSYDSLTVDFAKEIDATVILRGIRSIADFEYEKTIADANRQLSGIDTILLFTEPQHSFISSTVVRDVLRYGKDVSNFLPPNVELCDLKMQKV
ncbi:MAG: pantetheine-phosphate adenylyltransferase [Paludibacteraceae bacterium]|jgi:pantetheine-phosphate adenylyltransferase|nr:pantetheine-phosphate adenylyltransferase [Paludibacteraceae bacterium]MBO5862716.1 pantetheine-phosphate adenylyltransferase [Paludibacteraceae bacterium]MBO5988494.1 pantetheine-phosphate adenylyltransferase [Paludibacteraceae bacterium]